MSEAPKPKQVASRVHVPRRVRADFPFRGRVEPGDYDCECNQYGAVSVRDDTGELLGLKPDEFEVLAWKTNDAAREAEEKKDQPTNGVKP